MRGGSHKSWQKVVVDPCDVCQLYNTVNCIIVVVFVDFVIVVFIDFVDCVVMVFINFIVVVFVDHTIAVFVDCIITLIVVVCFPM